MLIQQWSRNFTVTDKDVEYLTGLLLEKETPMSSTELALALIRKRLEEEQSALESRYHNAVIYNPAAHYRVGDRLIFSQLDFATATVASIRAGDNPDYGDYAVITVKFDEDNRNIGNQLREFAAALQTDHALSAVAEKEMLPGSITFTAEDILNSGDAVLKTVENALQKNKDLIRLAGQWFPRDLVVEIDIGTLHLAEAVLDISGGGPLSPEAILEQIGTVTNAPIALQTFSLNLAMSQDKRFDEVGPAGEILWYLARMEPEAVRKIPDSLQYKPITFDEDLLSDAMYDLETELDDEHTDIEFYGDLKKATTVLIYPHRRLGTLPLNAKTRQIFPHARTPRIYVELVDGQDGTTYAGWVVHEFQYVYGLEAYYTKHRLPVGAYISVEKGEKPGQIIVSHEAYNARTEWVPVFVPGDQIQFENKRRRIGAAYDGLVLIGVDDLEALDRLIKAHQNKTLVSLLKILLTELGKLSPQGTVHVITLYSAVNVLRRCPPGPIFALLRANPEFEDVGDHYWRLN